MTSDLASRLREAKEGSRPPEPQIEYERGPCPVCGAITENDANGKCKPTSDETGEVYCSGEFDAQGFSIIATEASIEAHVAWWNEHGEALESELFAAKEKANDH